jgi:hypothetical protein
MNFVNRFITVFLIMVISSSFQEENGSIGKYYKIGDTGLRAQFPGQPVTSQVFENEVLRSVEYRFGFNSYDEDINLMYTVGVYTLKIDSLSGNSKKQIDFMAKATKIAFQREVKNSVVNFDEVKFKGNYCVRLKANIFNQFSNKMVVWNSIFFG